MYIYDHPSTGSRRPHNEKPGFLRVSQSHYASNSLLPSQYGDIESGSGLGADDGSGVRFARVEQQGQVIHGGTLGRGKVEVRSGERLEIEEMRKGTPIGRAIVPGYLALEYKGDQAAVTKWLQFAWFELTANIRGVTDRAVFPGSLPSIGGNPRQFTTDISKPQWFIDSANSADPFYDSAGLAHRSRESITIFDRPGMLIERTVPTVFKQAKAKSKVQADSVTFAAHYDSYLIQNNVPAYHVPWVATITFSHRERTQQKPPVYAIEGTAGPVTTLPDYLRTVLHSVYPSYTSIR